MSRNKNNNTTCVTYNSITVGTRIVGSIECETDFRIDGQLEGDIQCKGKVIVGEKATVEGNINSSNIEIAGNIIGNIITQDSFILRSSATFKGELTTQSIHVEPGGIFDGTCHMTNENNQHTKIKF